MVPIIGLMIAGYIIFRIVEIFARDTGYGQGKILIYVYGVILGIFCMIAIWIFASIGWDLGKIQPGG